jgi:hypothetical protein
MANLVPNDSKTLLTRHACAAALSAAGFPTSPDTLATKASRGGGPPYQKYGNRPLYSWGEALAWAQSRLGPVVRSTSEVDTVRPMRSDTGGRGRARLSTSETLSGSSESCVDHVGPPKPSRAECSGRVRWVRVSGRSWQCAAHHARASRCRGASTSNASSPEAGPVGTPMRGPGWRRNKLQSSLRSAVASWKPPGHAGALFQGNAGNPSLKAAASAREISVWRPAPAVPARAGSALLDRPAGTGYRRPVDRRPHRLVASGR